MPVYEYECSPCLVIYQVLQGMNDEPLQTCQRCFRLRAARHVGSKSEHAQLLQPTEAKYAKMSHTEEMAREKELQRDYETVWLPPQVKHDPWESRSLRLILK